MKRLEYLLKKRNWDIKTHTERRVPCEGTDTEQRRLWEDRDKTLSDVKGQGEMTMIRRKLKKGFFLRGFGGTVLC